MGWKSLSLRRKLLVALEIAIALNALAAGFLLVADPSGSALGLPGEMNGPFGSFRTPGVLLYLVGTLLGLAAIFELSSRRYAARVSEIAGIVLVGWILGQVALLGSVSPMQPVMAFLGLLIVWLSAGEWRDEPLRPAR